MTRHIGTKERTENLDAVEHAGDDGGDIFTMPRSGTDALEHAVDSG